MKRKIFRIFTLFLVIVIIFSIGSFQIANSANTQPYFVLISIDACRADYLEKVDMPNLKKLALSGTQYKNAFVGQLRNDTPPGHTTIATGSFPKNDGIIGFTWKNQETNKTVNVTTWEAVTTGLMTKTIKESGCTSIGTLLKEKYPDAKIAALSSDKFYAAAGLGAESADYILFSKNEKSTDPKTRGTTYLSPTGVNGHLAPADIMNDPTLRKQKTNLIDGDTWVIDLAIKILDKIKPQAMLINLPQTDESGHATGGITKMDTMSTVLKNVDVQIKRLIDAYKKAGIYDQTIWIVTADHGMTPHLNTIDDKLITKILDKQVAVPGGRTDYYLIKPENAWTIAESIAVLNIKGIRAVYYKTTDQQGKYIYIPAFTTSSILSKDLDFCYRYLLATYTSGKSPDLVIIPNENWKFKGNKMPGDHGSATWLNQHIPLIISGPGIKSGFNSDSVARLVDIAPTIVTLLGLKLEKMDGTVLADSLLKPTKDQIQKQNNLKHWLTPPMNAFREVSDLDIK
jgi:predicted AlkP superfamily pyrophosphatase or phosphodiesterase